MAYKILSIDGGGIRGVFALKILTFIQEEVDRDFLSSIDCFAGTSTGALIATALNLGISPKKLLFYYKNFGGMAFPANKKGEAKYRHDRLKTLLKTLVSSDLSFKDLDRGLIIPACKLLEEKSKRWEQRVYETFTPSEESLIDVAIRSSAAPLYFPSYQGYVDGGVFAGNPSMLALACVIDKEKGNKRPDEVRLLSLGNGLNPRGIDGEIDWGVSKWMDENYTLFELMTDMGMQTPDYPLKQILNDSYRRINAPLQEQVKMDQNKKISTLTGSAEYFRKNDPNWNEHKQWLKKSFLDR